MRHFKLLAASLVLFAACQSEPKPETVPHDGPNIDLLVDYMRGYYSSEAQAKRDTSYLSILLAMEPIWNDRNDGAWLYVEQAAAWTPKKPYRQRVYQLEQLSDSTFKSTMYKLADDSLYIGGHRETSVFDNLSPGQLEQLEGCALTLHFDGTNFFGSTDGRSCTNTWGEATYATSEARVYPDSLISWDRGYNDAGEQVWGAENGGYHFVKLSSGM